MKVRRLALVADAYGEWSKDGEIKNFLVRVHQDNLDGEHDSTNLEDTVERTANALAADRSTTILPIIFAMVFYVATVATAFGRTLSAANTESNTVYIHVEAHSLAFSAQFFWILPAVFLGSVIGVSQSENAIPHILAQFRRDLVPSLLPTEPGPPDIRTEADWRIYRIYCGGIYSWQPSEWQWPTPANRSTSTKGSNIGFRRRFLNALPSYIIVALGTGAGIAVSAFVPPDGWDCRNIAQLSIYVVWFFSACFDIGFNICIPLSKSQTSMDQSRTLWPWIPRFQPEGLIFERLQVKSHSLLFYLTFFKDFLAMGGTMGLVVATQVGILNRCDCYTQWGRTGLALSETPIVNEVLRKRMNSTYPALIFLCLGVELVVVPATIAWRYKNALGVFLQSDDNATTALWRGLCSLSRWLTTRFGQVRAAATRLTGRRESPEGTSMRMPLRSGAENPGIDPL